VDTALLRPGRFDKIIYVPPPDRAERKEVLQVHLRGRPTAKPLHLEAIAERTERFSGADLANVVTEAARRAMKRSLASGVTEPISGADLAAVLEGARPSISIAGIEEYERLRLGYERKVHFRDRTSAPASAVAGLDAARRDLTAYLDLALRQPERLQDFQMRAARGVLLFGPRGVGKAHLLRSTATELGASLHVLSVPLLLAAADPASEMRRLFYLARENTPALVLVDDVDHLAGEGPARPLLTQFLALLDGVGPRERLLVVATTGRPAALPDALFGMGRFERAFYVPPPDAEGRLRILESRLGGIPTEILPPETLRALAARLEGYSSGDLVAAMEEAKMAAVREGAPVLRLTHIEAGLARVRPSVTLEALAEAHEFSQRRSVRM